MKKTFLKSNPTVAKILIARFIHMTPEQQQSIKGIVTPANTEAMKILLPELARIGKGANNGK